MGFLVKLIEAGVLVGGAALLGKFLIAAIARDAAKRITLNLRFLMFFSKLLGFLPKHPLWSGAGIIRWTVESDNFKSTNWDVAQIYRVFNTVGLEAKVTRVDGKKVPYRFVGKLSREQTILTGEWFDSRGKVGNYHGAYQLRYLIAQSKAEGKWIGFSDTTTEIKVGSMTFEKQNEKA